jgi:hypothetical protein
MRESTGMKRLRPLIVAALVVVVAALLIVQFVRSVRETRAEPYTVTDAVLTGWEVVVGDGTGPTAALLLARAPEGLAGGLFRQVFTRAMESLGAPGVAGVPLLLRQEFDGAFAAHTTVDELQAVARASLDHAPFRPRCMVVRRVSEPGLTRQAYVLFFESPAFEAFRQHLATRASPTFHGAAFDPLALSPVMIVAATPPMFDAWLPLRIDNAERECVAPVQVQ